TVESPLAGVGPADAYNRSPREFALISSGATVIGDGVLALAPAGAERPNVVFCQLAPWQFDEHSDHDLKRTHRRTCFLVARLLAIMGVAGTTPLLGRFHSPLRAEDAGKRWLTGLYPGAPEEWDDPYRFFRWC